MTLMTYTMSSPYTNKDSSKGVHSLCLLVEFVGCDWKAKEIVSESGRPSFAGDPLNMSGAIAPMFIGKERAMRGLGFNPFNAV